MDSLFDQLKSGAPIESSTNESAPLPRSPSSSPPAVCIESPILLLTPSPPPRLDTPPASTTKTALNKSLVSLETPNTVTSPRRESMPPPTSSAVCKSNNKSRSLSPTNVGKMTKPLRVLVGRCKKPEQSKIQVKQMKNGEKSSPMFTPTKAQQKLFDPAVLEKAQQLTQPKLKRCMVRVKRQNLKKLQEKMLKSRKTKSAEPKKTEPISPKSAAGTGKRKANNSFSSLDSSTSPSKNARMGKQGKPSFFIKLNTGRVESPVNKKSTSSKTVKLQSSNKKKKLVSSTKPTKFTRTQLIKAYGKRYFRAHVKIERCTHPMMLIFESNARARRLQAKRNKSKNLSVSFREQVEIFGDTSDSEVSVSELDLEASTSKSAKIKAAALVTPARLKKVENGKVIDDIELDPSLFVLPQEVSASTPFTPRARKKREKKSYSPLKDDGTPSPRKEQLKLANEKMPPSGLRRLTIDDVDEDDDEDDECEYIVPIEIPARRSSRASSMSAVDECITEAKDVATSTPAKTKDVNKNKASESSSERLTPSDESQNKEKENNPKRPERETSTDNIEEPTNNAASPLERFGSVSPAHSLNSLNDFVDSLINNSSQDQTNDLPSEKVTRADETIEEEQNNENVDDVPKLVADDVSKLGVGFSDDLSLQYFTEDVTQNLEANDSELVDGIINERIDELAKEKSVNALCTTTSPREIAAE